MSAKWIPEDGEVPIGGKPSEWKPEAAGALAGEGKTLPDVPRYRLRRIEDGSYVGFVLDADPNGDLCRFSEVERSRWFASWAEAALSAAPAPAQQPSCATCNGNGMIGGPSFYAPDEGGVPCPDCAQQPAVVGDDSALRQAAREGMRLLRVNGYDAAADELETALTPAATPVPVGGEPGK